MKSVANKYTTLRTATAESIVCAIPEVVAACARGETPKGNVIDVARTAGIMAAKRTPDIIPFCHPILIDHVEIDIKCEGDKIFITSKVTATAKTGVEMEAMTAASVAALTVYDMLKPMDSNIEILHTKLLEKRGGKSDLAKKIDTGGLRAAVLITSDRCANGETKDLTGPVICDALKNLNIDVGTAVVVADDLALIEAKLGSWCKEGVDLVITSGGTGVGPRDVTANATRAVIEYELPGIVETLRSYGQSRTPFAMLSRGVAGVAGKTVIVNLPGSVNAVGEGLSVLFPAVFHVFAMFKSKPHK